MSGNGENNDGGDRDRKMAVAMESSTAAPEHSSSVSRPPTERPVYKLTMKLIDTYKHVNSVYFAAKALKTQQNRSRNRNGVQNDGFDDNSYDLILVADEVFNNRYVLKAKIGKGSFGFCVSAFDRLKGVDVAIKIIKSKKPFFHQAQTEINILEELAENDPEDSRNCVRLLDKFMHLNHQCIVFEMLSHNLYELLKNTKMLGVSLSLVKKFARQLLHTLDYLSSPQIDIIHCDLKPENILLRFPRRSAIKLIDFGSSCKFGNKSYTYIVSRFYRAPEILLGLPYSHKIDMWSLACVLVELHTGEPIFGGLDQVDQMARIIAYMGMPPITMIDASPGSVRGLFFDKVYFKSPKECSDFISVNPGYRVVSVNQTHGYVFKKAKDVVSSDQGSGLLSEPVGSINSNMSSDNLYNLLVAASSKRRHIEQNRPEENYAEFISFINSILVYDPGLRASPIVASSHPFASISGEMTDISSESRSFISHSSSISSLKPEYPDEAPVSGLGMTGAASTNLPLISPASIPSAPRSMQMNVAEEPADHLPPSTSYCLEFMTGSHGQYLHRVIHFASEESSSMMNESDHHRSGGNMDIHSYSVSTNTNTSSSTTAGSIEMETSNNDDSSTHSRGAAVVSSSSSNSGLTRRATGSNRLRSRSADRSFNNSGGGGASASFNNSAAATSSLYGNKGSNNNVINNISSSSSVSNINLNTSSSSSSTNGGIYGGASMVSSSLPIINNSTTQQSHTFDQFQNTQAQQQSAMAAPAMNSSLHDGQSNSMEES